MLGDSTAAVRYRIVFTSSIKDLSSVNDVIPKLILFPLTEGNIKCEKPKGDQQALATTAHRLSAVS